MRHVHEKQQLVFRKELGVGVGGVLTWASVRRSGSQLSSGAEAGISEGEFFILSQGI